MLSEPEHIFQLGVESAREGDRESATRLFRLLVGQRPGHARGWLWLGGLSVDRDERRGAFERALELDPGSVVARKGLLLLAMVPGPDEQAGAPAASARGTSGPPPAPIHQPFTRAAPTLDEVGPAGATGADGRAAARHAPTAPFASLPAGHGNVLPTSSVSPAAAGLRERYAPPERRLTVDVGQATVKLRLSDSGGLRVYASPCRIDPAALLALEHDPAAYGRALFAAVFHGELSAEAEAGRSTLDGYGAALSGGGEPLRLELLLERNCGYLHSLRWEYLLPPDSAEPLAIRERAPLYRLADEATPPAPRPRADHMRVVVAVASPRTLGLPGNRYLAPLAPLDSAQEREIIVSHASLQRAGLARVQVLSREESGPVTVGALRHAAAAGCDVLHLICHGQFIGDEFYLVMEGETGEHEFVGAQRLVASLADHLPALVVLSACQSAVSHEGDALRGLAARLVRAGASAVLAMQDLMPVGSARLFSRRFYQHLARCGRVEVAVAAARKDLFGAPAADDPARDWAIPLLLLRHGLAPLIEVDNARAILTGTR